MFIPINLFRAQLCPKSKNEKWFLCFFFIVLFSWVHHNYDTNIVIVTSSRTTTKKTWRWPQITPSLTPNIVVRLMLILDSIQDLHNKHFTFCEIISLPYNPPHPLCLPSFHTIPSNSINTSDLFQSTFPATLTRFVPRNLVYFLFYSFLIHFSKLSNRM